MTPPSSATASDALRQYVAKRLNKLNQDQHNLETKWDTDPSLGFVEAKDKFIQNNARIQELERIWNRYFEKGD